MQETGVAMRETSEGLAMPATCVRAAAAPDFRQRLPATEGELAGEIALVRAALARFLKLQHDGIAEPISQEHELLTLVRLNKIGNVLRFERDDFLSDDGWGRTGGFLDAYRRKTIAINSATLSATLHAAAGLREEKVDFVLFKGPLQQKELYGDYYAKPSGDVDILVHPGDFASARACLMRHGYGVERRANSLWWSHFLGEQHMVRDGGAAGVIDLHHRLQQPGMPRPRDSALFMARAATIDLAGTALPFLDPADTVLLSAISIAKAFFNREPCASHVCDLHAGLRRMDTAGRQALVQRAQDEGLHGTLMLGVRTCWSLLGVWHDGLSGQSGEVLPATGDDELRLMILAPWLNAIDWPKRRDILWNLCDRRYRRFMVEAAWAASSEVGRRLWAERGNA